MAKSKKPKKAKKRPSPRPVHNLTLEQAATIFDNDVVNLISRYYSRYIELGHALSKEALLALDAIDLRSVLVYDDYGPESGANPWHSWVDPSIRSFTDLPDEDQNRILTLRQYSLIPPFPEGVFRINEDRYLYFRITDISKLESDEMVGLYIRNYTQAGTIWTPGAGIDGVLKHDAAQDAPNQPYSVIGTIDEKSPAISTKKIVKTLTQKQLGWTDRDWTKFHSAPVPKAHNEPVALIRLYNLCIWLLNIYLDKYRPSRPVKTGALDKTRTIIIETPEQGPQNEERRVRTIGPVSIASRKVPKLQNKESIVHYRTVQWGRVAHIRRYKSGKIAMIPATVCKRRAVDMDENGSATARKSTTIVVKKPKED